MRVSHDLLDDPSESAQRDLGGARSESVTAESSAPAQSTAVSGEIRNDGVLGAFVSPTTTLMGVPAFSAVRKAALDMIPMHVTPATVTAIEKAKRRSTEPTIKVDLDAFDTIVDGAPFAKLDGIPTARPSKPGLRIERDRSKVKLKGDHAEPPIQIEVPGAQKPWQTFEDLGLAPKPITKAAQKLMVSTYRLIGFGILSLIVFVLLGYISTTAFYFLNRSWITPVAVSANDEKVVALQGQLEAQLNERAKLVSDLEQAERSIRAEQAFQLQFAKAIRKDVAGRRIALDRVQQLAHTAAATREEIRTTNGDFSASTASKMDNEYKARLIDRDAMLAGKFQLAQITSANLALAERQAEFDQRADELAAQTQSLDALLSNKSATAALSYDVLKIARDYETSKLVVAREVGNRERLKASIVRQNKIIDGVNQSAYLRAIADHATVALVPYTNLDKIKKGTPLYGCKLNMVLCHEVGKVLDVLPGEVLVKHPNRDTMVRGRMIEMQMSDASAAQDEVLFAGSKPLGF